MTSYIVSTNSPISFDRAVKYSSSDGCVILCVSYILTIDEDPEGVHSYQHRAHTYDPIISRMQITRSNHSVEQRDHASIFLKGLRRRVTIPSHVFISIRTPFIFLFVHTPTIVSFLSSWYLFAGSNKLWTKTPMVSCRFLFFTSFVAAHCIRRDAFGEEWGEGKWNMGIRRCGFRSVFARKWPRIDALCENEKVTKMENKDMHMYA